MYTAKQCTHITCYDSMLTRTVNPPFVISLKVHDKLTFVTEDMRVELVFFSKTNVLNKYEEFYGSLYKLRVLILSHYVRGN